MLRNLGGAVGTATLGTILTKREQFHSNIIGQSVTLARDEVRQRIDDLTHYFLAHGISDPATAQLGGPARSLGSTQRRLHDQAMERRNSRDIGLPSPMIEGHDCCGDKSAAQSGLFNQNRQTEVEMAIVLAKNNLMPTPIVDPKEIDSVGRNVISQLRRCLETKPGNQSVPESY